MTAEVRGARLDTALWECDRHRATLGGLSEPHEAWPMRDRLDRLERLGFLDVDAWLQWRDVRNRLAHEYPDQPQLRFAAVLATVAAAQAMVQAFDHWKLALPA